jgi:hypothetical protein
MRRHIFAQILLSITVGSGEWALPGTLTLPAGRSRVPADEYQQAGHVASTVIDDIADWIKQTI